MSTERDLLTSRIILRAIFPVIKVVVAEDPKFTKKFSGVSASIQFVGNYNGEQVGAAIVFTDGAVEIEQGIIEKPDLTFRFKTIEKMNAMLAGKLAVPRIKGLGNFGLLLKSLALLMRLKILLPTTRPSAPADKRLKVKMIIYMITTALSQYNKGGDPQMTAWTAKQPDRIYQMSLDSDEDIAAYVRVKAGKTKAGRGHYKRRRPFVHMKFKDVDSALAVFLKDADFVEALGRDYVFIEGAPEYAANLNDFMQRIQAMVS